MQLELTKERFQELLRLTFIGEIVINGDRFDVDGRKNRRTHVYNGNGDHRTNHEIRTYKYSI